MKTSYQPAGHLVKLCSLAVLSLIAVVACSKGDGGTPAVAPVGINGICAPGIPCTGINSAAGPVYSAVGQSGAGTEQIQLNFYDSTTAGSGVVAANGYLVITTPSSSCGYQAGTYSLTTATPGQLVSGGLSFAPGMTLQSTDGQLVVVMQNTWLTPSGGATTSMGGVNSQYRFQGYVQIYNRYSATQYCQYLGPILLD